MASERKALVRDALVVVGIFLLAGVFCGWMWHQIWQPAPEGVVFDGIPRFEDDVEFRSTGLYFLIAVIAGLVLGIITTLVFERDEVWTLVAVVVGALLAGAVMATLGHALGPDSAADFARSADDFEPVTGDLHTSLLPVLVSFPGGALVGSVTMLTLFTRRVEREPAG